MLAARFRAVVDDHFDFVWRTLRRLGVPPEDVDDAAQRVFVLLAQRLERSTQGRERERAMLLAILAPIASARRNERDRGPRAAHLDFDELDFAAPDHVLLERTRRMLQRLLDAMAWEECLVFVLCELERLSERESAALLGIPESLVASRLRTARSALRRAIREGSPRPVHETAPSQRRSG